MNNKKIMKILLIEDDVIACNNFENFIKTKTDVQLVATTNSSIEALKLVEKHLPNVIILDLELHFGSGSGLQFIKDFQNLNLKYKPIIIVTTNVKSRNVYNKLHEEFVDLIFYKQQSDYSPKIVINDAFLLFEQDNNTDTFSYLVDETIEDTKQKLFDIINLELDKIGINYKLKGREYIFEAIYYLLTEDPNVSKDYSFIQYLSCRYKLLTTSIGRAIQTAINEAWRTSPIEDLRAHYTAKINYHTGVLTPTEFVYYYVKKIKELI